MVCGFAGLHPQPLDRLGVSVHRSCVGRGASGRVRDRPHHTWRLFGHSLDRLALCSWRLDSLRSISLELSLAECTVSLDTPRGASRRRVASLSRPTRPDRSHRGVPVPTRTLFEHERSTGHGTVDRSSELNRATRNACDGAVATLLNYIELLLKCLQLNLCP